MPTWKPRNLIADRLAIEKAGKTVTMSPRNHPYFDNFVDDHQCHERQYKQSLRDRAKRSGKIRTHPRLPGSWGGCATIPMRELEKVERRLLLVKSDVGSWQRVTCITKFLPLCSWTSFTESSNETSHTLHRRILSKPCRKVMKSAE
jgi:hypothetical protein